MTIDTSEELRNKLEKIAKDYYTEHGTLCSENYEDKMTTLQNMKFKVSSPEQSERLQRVLFSLGYKWTTGSVQETEKPHLYAYDSGLLMHGNCDRHFESKVFPEQDTDLFIASHESRADKMATMCFRDSDEGKAVFKGLETAWDEPLITERPWYVNDGTKPDLPEGTKIDVELADFGLHTAWSVDMCSWVLSLGAGRIIKWRFHKPEDAEGYEQPKTVQGGWGNSGAKICLAPSPNGNIDAHYNFTYHLTQDDVDMGFIKIDPYFVSQQWQLGSKDSTGVIFHLLKTIARFGDKNGKDREINALYKSTIRLAQLEGVELK